MKHNISFVPPVSRHRFLPVKPAVFVAATILAAASFGQQSSPPPAVPTKPAARANPVGTDSASTSRSIDEETVTLSPFVVTAEEDTGYQATSTLAGTRLRSNLKDLAPSISVATKDFMQDIDATDLRSLLTYTLGTEVNGPSGNFSGLADFGGVYDDAQAQATPNTRVRGLSSADVTRDYFLTDSPMDSYNVDRVEISRGANSMLFGLGSPAGIVNSSLIKANLDRQRTNVGAEYGSYGTGRVTLDHNQILIPHVLALRIATVYGDTKYRIDDSFERKKSLFLTGTYHPFHETTIRANAEFGRSDSNKPEMRPPFDGITNWWNLGMPVFNPVTQTGHLLGTPAAGYPTAFNAAGAIQNSTNIITSGIGNSIRGDAPTLVYSDPYSAATGIPGTPYDGLKPNGTGFYSIGQTNTGMRQMQVLSTFLRNISHVNDVGRLAFNEPEITDPNIFDFYHHQLEGPTKYEWSKWENYNVTFEQTFFEGKAGVELALDKQLIQFGHMMPIDYRITLDINEKLPDGETNPNFLRPNVTGNGFTRWQARGREAGRLTGFYDLDLKPVGPKWLGQILGHHVFNANYSDQTATEDVKGGTPVGTGLDYPAAEGLGVGSVSSVGRIFFRTHYIGDSVSGAATPADANIVGINALQFPSNDLSATLLYNARPVTGQTTPSPWKSQAFEIVTNPYDDVVGTSRGSYLLRRKTTIKSEAATAQSFWLDGLVVSTVGWRRDHVKTFSADAGAVDPATGIGIDDWDVLYPKPVSSVSEDSTNWGVVLHSPEFIKKHLPLGTDISLIYNKSSNFRVAGQRFDINGTALGPEIGDTKEYGVRLATFNGKFEVKFAHFETVAGNATVNSFTGAFNDIADTIGGIIEQNAAGRNAGNPAGIAAFEQWLSTPFAQNYLKTFNYQLNKLATPSPTLGSYASSTSNRRSGEIVGTSALTSKGVEFEMVFNPTKSWRIAANVGRSQAIFNDVAPEFQSFVDGLSSVLLTSQIGQPVQATPMGALLSTTATDTWAARHVSRVVNAVLPTFLQQGAPTSELREWRFNAVTNYTFREGFLKGWSVGANVRWEDEGAIGFPYATVDGQNIPDVKHPYKSPALTTWGANIGYTRKLTGKIDWTARLYVANIGVGNELLPLTAQPDGSIATWRIREPQRWTFSNSFTF